jgi:iron complex transport system ATP-binding protein
MNAPFFQIDAFSCGYEQFRLDRISFELEKGSFSGIIGPNGSGKTTLLKGIAQTLPKLSGKLQLQGQDLSDLSPRQIAKQLSIVSQFEPLGQISLYEYVLMGRIPYHRRFQFFERPEDREIAEHYMRLTGLIEWKDKRMNELSGGEQQRAAIARALTQEPALLLLDEPTAHLDITHQVRVLDLIQKLNDELKLSVLMVIHDLNLASEYCDQLIMLHEGKLFTRGNPVDVLNFETIEKVYQTPVITRINPYSGKPVVFLISEKMLRRRKTEDRIRKP